MMAAFARGAELAGRPITWRTEGGRPVGVRAPRKLAPADGGADVPRFVDRDERIFVLPQAGMAVMAPPAYAALLLGTAHPDAGAAPSSAQRWRELAARIDAEAAASPDDAILSMSATNLMAARARRSDGPLTGPNGLALPTFVTLNAGVTPAPFLEVSGQFAHASDAAAWAAAWPGWKQTLLGSPLLLLSGFSSIVARAEVEQDDRALAVRTNGSNEELRRLLAMIANLLGPGARR
jgi:hypothetical protein